MEKNKVKSLIINTFLNFTENRSTHIIELYRKIFRTKFKRRCILSNLKYKKRIRRKVPKNSGFWQTISEMPGDVFFAHFRMKPATCENLQLLATPTVVPLIPADSICEQTSLINSKQNQGNTPK